MCSTNLSFEPNHEVTCYAHCLETIFPRTQDNNCYWIGGWVKVDADELQKQVSNKYNHKPAVTHQEIRDAFIELLIHKTNDCSYGAGLVYELYEERKQSAIKYILRNLSLTHDEVTLIKNQCDYTEDMEPFMDSCDRCGADIDALQLAKSLQWEGKACCVNCLTY